MCLWWVLASGWKENNVAESCVMSGSGPAASASGVEPNRSKAAFCRRDVLVGPQAGRMPVWLKGDGDHDLPLAETHLGLFRNPCWLFMWNKVFFILPSFSKLFPYSEWTLENRKHVCNQKNSYKIWVVFSV